MYGAVVKGRYKSDNKDTSPITVDVQAFLTQVIYIIYGLGLS